VDEGVSNKDCYFGVSRRGEDVRLWLESQVQSRYSHCIPMRNLVVSTPSSSYVEPKQQG
jgi:hypothetical protein